MTPGEKNKKLDKLEKLLWEAKRPGPEIIPGDDFEKKVLNQIQKQKVDLEKESVIVVMNRLAWKVLPVAATLLLFFSVLSFSGGQKNEEWLNLMIGQDTEWNSTWFEEDVK